MFGTYAQVLRRPGALRFTAAGFLARMQMSMIGLGAVMMLSAERGSFAVAGAVAAIYALSNAIIGPQVSRLIDSFGQSKVVPAQLLVHVPALLAMIAFTLWTSLTWPIYLLAFVAGASQPIMGPLVRARWSVQLHGSPLLRTAFAWESLIDEAVFIIGPPLVTVVALQVNPSAGLLLATIMLIIGTVLLLAQRTSEPKPTGRHAAAKGKPAILLPGVAAIAAVFVMMGGLFGSFEVTTVAFTKAAGVPEAAGVVLALYAVGSLLAGLVFGALALRATLLRQFMISTATLAVVTAPLPFLPQVWQIAVGLFVAGLACSPVLISGMAFVERVVPSGRLTESMAWVTSGVAVGIAVASPLAGVIIDEFGAHTAYWVTSGSAILAVVVALAFLPSLRRAQAGVAEPVERVLAAGKPSPTASPAS